MSLERSLHALGRDPLGRALLAAHDPALVARVLVAADPYGEVGALLRAASALGHHVVDPEAWLAHRLWCASRRAGGASRSPLDVQVEGAAYLAETVGHPTMLVAPMTLDTADALEVIAATLTGRRRIVYGDGVSARDTAGIDVEVAEEGSEVPHILEVLTSDGVYCTYGDFSYAGHSALTTTLFGHPRAMSRGWVSLAARPGTMLLPFVALRDDDAVPERVRVRARFGEPVLVHGAGGRADLGLLALLLARMIENGIRDAGAQWLLLPTLTFEAPQAAPVRSAPASSDSVGMSTPRGDRE